MWIYLEYRFVWICDISTSQHIRHRICRFVRVGEMLKYMVSYLLMCGYIWMYVDVHRYLDVCGFAWIFDMCLNMWCHMSWYVDIFGCMWICVDM